MKVNTMIRSLKTTRYALLLLPFFQLSYANLTVETAKTIQGTLPRLSDELENDLKNDGELKQFFGLNVNGKNYYGQESISNMPVPISYPFYNQITPAKIRQPDNTQYFDRDGDEFDYMTADSGINMVWLYTNSENKEVEFYPKSTDTFCSLAEEEKYAPFKVKLSADLVLFSKYGDPDYKTYPNNDITNQPSAIFTVLEDVGVCYAKPELDPNDVGDGGKYQFDRKKGFLTQSNVDPTKNFPTTGFYGARFELNLSKNAVYKDYDWYVKQGNELVYIEKDSNSIPSVVFKGASAKDSKKAWDLVMGSSKGYLVIIEGKNKKTNKTFQYSFTITKWFESWRPVDVVEKPGAEKGDVVNVVSACESKKGHYRLAHAEDMSNAVLNAKGEGQFSREIGKLISEWGDANQKTYPGSFAPGKKGSYRYFYVWDPTVGDYCDIHLNNGKYHCRDKENEKKNGVCASYRP